jgi:hypothetical protein
MHQIFVPHRLATYGLKLSTFGRRNATWKKSQVKIIPFAHHLTSCLKSPKDSLPSVYINLLNFV